MKKCLVMNLKHSWYSKRIVMGLLFSILLLMGIQLINYSAVKDTHNEYKRKVDFYKDDPEAMKEDLDSGYKISMSEDGNSGVIENPLSYFKEQLKNYIYTASPANALAQMQEATVIIFPIIFGIFGAVCSTLDSKYKMNKIKKIRYSKNTYFFAKHLSMYLEYAIIVIVTFIIGKLSNLLIYERIKRDINVNDFCEYSIDNTNMQISIYRWILVLVIGLIFIELGAGIAIIAKYSIVAIISIFLYLYIVPVLGKWDLKNVMYYLYNEVFEFKGVVNVKNACEGTNSFISVSSLLIVFLVSIVLSYVCERKRSAYEI